MTTLYGMLLSPYVRKVMVTLDLKSIPYKHEMVSPSFGSKSAQNAPSNWQEISPLGKIPALSDEHVSISDSSVICDYLDARYPQKPLFPLDFALRARCKWYEEYADTAAMDGLITPFRQRIVFPAMLGQEPDEALVQKSIQEQEPPVFDYLERCLKGKEYLVGDSLSMADISVVSPMMNMHYANHSIDAKRWPNVAGYYQRIVAVPEIAKIQSMEQDLLKGARP